MDTIEGTARVATGIEGLDKLVSGGLPTGSTVLLTGSCGTGKSILSLEYIVNGALRGEAGLYVTFEETADRVIQHGKSFNMDIEGLIKQGLVEVYTVETDDIGETLVNIKEKAQKLGVKRLVIDSLTTMMEHGVIYRSQVSKEMSRISVGAQDMRFPTEGHELTRKDIYYIIGRINRLNTTAILISEVAEKSNYLSRDTISEFACDGVIMLEINMIGGTSERLISVKKMRGTPVDLRMSIMKFGLNGIEVEE